MAKKHQDARSNLSTDRDAWWDSINIQDAWRLLPTRPFNMWIVFHTIRPHQLGYGSIKLAKFFGMPKRTFAENLHVLVEEGFIVVDRGRVCTPVTIRLIKRATIYGSSYFVNLPSGVGRMKKTLDEQDIFIQKYGNAAERKVTARELSAKRRSSFMIDKTNNRIFQRLKTASLREEKKIEKKALEEDKPYVFGTVKFPVEQDRRARLIKKYRVRNLALKEDKK